MSFNLMDSNISNINPTLNMICNDVDVMWDVSFDSQVEIEYFLQNFFLLTHTIHFFLIATFKKRMKIVKKRTQMLYNIYCMQSDLK